MQTIGGIILDHGQHDHYPKAFVRYTGKESACVRYVIGDDNVIDMVKYGVLNAKLNPRASVHFYGWKQDHELCALRVIAGHPVLDPHLAIVAVYERFYYI